MNTIITSTTSIGVENEASVVPVIIEISDTPMIDDLQQPQRRNWDHGHTQVTDDMFWGGLMCE